MVCRKTSGGSPLLDLKFIREHPDRVKEAIRAKGEDGVDLERLLELDARRRSLLGELESLRAERNRTSEEIGRKKQAGEDAAHEVRSMREVGDRIRRLEEALRELDAEIRAAMLRIPNLPHADVPLGKDESENVEVRRWGEPTLFAFDARPHWELGPALNLLDFERAGVVTGARFAFYRGAGARLLRALMTFMLDLHTREHGYEEIWPPLLVSRDSMIGTGQLPKFEDDAFRVAQKDYFLIPTAEVPVTNLHRNEILSADDLPRRYVAYSPCFRAEAGAAGRDTRGLIRQHQFDKVELVNIVLPEDSDAALETLVREAEAVLQRLALPYRVVLMCTGDTGFAQSKKYDLEVWMPSYGRYVEVSSCSNFEAFQARRANIRFRREPGSRPEFVHTLNGSGLAIGRTLAAILENGQTADGKIIIPEALQPYFGADRIEPSPGKAP